MIFEKWLLENGARFPKLELKVPSLLFLLTCSMNFQKDYGDEVRGCHAITDLDEDEVAIEIPLRCMITVEMGKDTDVNPISSPF